VNVHLKSHRDRNVSVGMVCTVYTFICGTGEAPKAVGILHACPKSLCRSNVVLCKKSTYHFVSFPLVELNSTGSV
jgi:hypothetical protein